MRRLITLLISHLAFAGAGFALGIYMLPILTAPAAPSAETIASARKNLQYTTHFHRDLPGSDFLHWGDGTVSIGKAFIVFQGEIAPGPDYRLYLSPETILDEADFNRHRASAAYIGEVPMFGDFIAEVPSGVDIDDYSTVVIWCESFGEFITSASYR